MKAAIDISQNLVNTLRTAYDAILAGGLLPVMYQLPGSELTEVLAGKLVNRGLNHTELNPGESGFLIKPFEGDRYYLLDPIFRLKADKFGSIVYSNGIPESNLNEWTKTQKSVSSSHILNSLSGTNESQKYLNLVSKAVASIQSGEMKKIVLSRFREYSFQKPIHPVVHFSNLLLKQPEAFVSLTYLPSYGVWIGATPELLAGVDREGIFHTVALAGTQPYLEDQSINSVRWNQKEIEEQALVSRFVIDCFKKVRVREFEETGPKTTRSGRLLHLKTSYTVNTKAISYPNLTHVMMGLLHPTSAVCGYPKEKAAEFIKAYEGYDRLLYSGHLGPWNLDNETWQFVNLRCFQVKENTIKVYAGAGITGDSEPERELAETELKMENILQNLI